MYSVYTLYILCQYSVNTLRLSVKDQIVYTVTVYTVIVYTKTLWCWKATNCIFIVYLLYIQLYIHCIYTFTVTVYTVYIRIIRKQQAMRFQLKIPDSSFKFLFPFVWKLVLHRLHCSAKIMIIVFGCSHSTYCVVMFHFLFCVVFSKLLQTAHYCLCPSPCSCWTLTILWKEKSYLNASILIFTPSL